MKAVEKPIFTHTKIRSPFTIKKIPLLAKVYINGYKGYKGLARKAVFGLPFRLLFKILHSAGLGGYGEVIFSAPYPKVLLFRARNTQFHSIYLPKYLQGYEAETMTLLDLILNKEDTFYDIGSNWGHFSFYVASSQDFKGQIHAFEPIPTSFHDLMHMVRQAGLERQIIGHNIALSNLKGSGYMVFSHALHSGTATLSRKPAGFRIQMERLDDLKIPSPRVMKIDAEEHEYNILEGAQHILTQCKPAIVFESWRNFQKPKETLGPFYLLEKMGYRFFQPAFFVTCQDREGAYAIGYEKYNHLPQEVDLALFPFSKEYRFLLDDQINVFACHQSQIPELKSIFHDSLD